MVTATAQEPNGRAVVKIRCEGCPRVATGRGFAVTAFRALIGWERCDGIDLCSVCLWRRGVVPAFARRLRDLTDRG
jgi:hypothetical protein